MCDWSHSISFEDRIYIGYIRGNGPIPERPGSEGYHELARLAPSGLYVTSARGYPYYLNGSTNIRL